LCAILQKIGIKFNKQIINGGTRILGPCRNVGSNLNKALIIGPGVRTNGTNTSIHIDTFEK